MFSRHRGTVIALGLATFLALLGGTWLYADASRLQIIYEHQTEQKAKHYADSARIRVERRCADLVRTERRPCVYEEYNRAAQGQHDEYDLQAQLVTSVWTRAMGIAAIIGMAVGILGIGLIYKTFEETRRSAAAGEASAEASQRAASYAGDAATAAAEALYGVERPVILISMSRDRPRFFPEGASFFVDFRNVGQQVGMAFGISGRFVVTDNPSDLPELKTFGCPPGEHCTAMMLGEIAMEPDGLPYTFELQRSRLTEAEIAGLADRSLLGFFVARVLYSDLLQKMRNLTVLFLYEPPTPGAPHGRFIQLTHGETRAEATDHSIRMNAHRRELQETLPIFWGAMREAAQDDFKEAPQKPRWYLRLWRRR